MWFMEILNPQHKHRLFKHFKSYNERQKLLVHRAKMAIRDETTGMAVADWSSPPLIR